MLGWGGCWWEKGERLTFRISRLNRVISLWKMKPVSLLSSGFNGFCHLYLSFILKQRPHWTRFISIFHQNVLLVIRRESFLFLEFSCLYSKRSQSTERKWMVPVDLPCYHSASERAQSPTWSQNYWWSELLSPNKQDSLFPGIPCGLNLLSQKQRPSLTTEGYIYFFSNLYSFQSTSI